ncbi:hypothetical protein GE09DRAFT_1287036 [Coniochaeta sp. 2T2.1]|nr:hypothetical protein GE09DRAFT_1287036 [Coniochaeta sp. 2T2.1]
MVQAAGPGHPPQWTNNIPKAALDLFRNHTDAHIGPNLKTLLHREGHAWLENLRHQYHIAIIENKDSMAQQGHRRNFAAWFIWGFTDVHEQVMYLRAAFGHMLTVTSFDI